MTEWGPWTLGDHRWPGAGGGEESGAGLGRVRPPQGRGRRCQQEGQPPHPSSDDSGHKPALHSGPTPTHDATLTRKPLKTDVFF